MKYDKQRFETPAKYIEYLQILAQDTLSLNIQMGYAEEGWDVEFGDTIEYEGPGPDEIAINGARRGTLLKLLEETLSPREHKIMLMRFGFGTGSNMTLDEVGKQFNVTRERIRQIEAKSLLKLREKLKELNIKEGDI